MDLKTYLKSLPDEAAREKFAADCNTTVGHLRNCIYVAGKTVAPTTCVLIEQATSGVVMRWHLRQEDWWRIWPELIGMDGAPQPEPAKV